MFEVTLFHIIMKFINVNKVDFYGRIGLGKCTMVGFILLILIVLLYNFFKKSKAG